MTKAREPNTFEDAILRIADRIGWDAAADVVGKGERVVRNWSDPDMDRRPDIEECLKLDMAYLSAGGSAPAPLLAVYLARMDRAAAKPSCPAQIVQATVVAAKEAGEAIAASVAASQTSACGKARASADRELGQAIKAMQDLQTKLATTAVD